MTAGGEKRGRKWRPRARWCAEWKEETAWLQGVGNPSPLEALALGGDELTRGRAPDQREGGQSAGGAERAGRAPQQQGTQGKPQGQ